MSTNGFEVTPHEDFAVFDAAFTVAYAGREWPEACVRMHLRWLVGEHILGRLRTRDFPTVRQLAVKWGWRSVERVAAFLTRTAEVDVKGDGKTARVTMLHWQDPYRRVPLEALRGDRMVGANRIRETNGGRTAAERQANGGRTVATDERRETEESPNGGRTAGERQANGGRTPCAVSPRAFTSSPITVQGIGGQDARAAAPVVIEPKPAAPRSDGASSWTPPRAECGGHDRLAVAGMVLDVLAQIRAPAEATMADTPLPVVPDRCGTDAPVVLALWRADGRREPGAFAQDLVLVARAARWCPDPVFGREVRGEGWADGQDRSRKVANVCRQRPPAGSSGATWEERLVVARQWAAAGCPVATPPPIALVHSRDRPAPRGAAGAAASRRAALNALDDALANLGAR
jgi:hypothetical protein